MGQKQAVNCGIATRRDLCVGRLTLGKHHTRTHVRTCAHAHMGTCHVRTYMRQTTVPRRVTVSRRLVETSAWEGSRKKTSYAYSYAYMHTCVRAYMRTSVRTHARTHVRMCTCIAHMSARMIFFPSVSLSTHRSTSRDTVASRMSRGTAVYRLLLIHRLLLILFVRMSVRLTCAVTHVRTYEYAYWAFPA